MKYLILLILMIFLFSCQEVKTEFDISIPSYDIEKNGGREGIISVDEIIEVNRERLEVQVNIPDKARRFHRLVHRTSQTYYGLNPPVAMHGALIHQESRWRKNVESPVGAQGLAQFMPQTGEWLEETFDEIEDFQPMNPRWSINAMVFYTKHLKDQIDPIESEELDEKEHWAFIHSSYNGGIGWLNRDRRLTIENKDDPDIWFSNVENYSNRSDSAFEENRNHVDIILNKWRIKYKKAGWNPGAY